MLATPPRISLRCHVLHRHEAPGHPPCALSVFFTRTFKVDVTSPPDWPLRKPPPDHPGGRRFLTISDKKTSLCMSVLYLYVSYGIVKVLNLTKKYDNKKCRNHITWDSARRHKLPRKEVIQPHLPVRLPCYDFVPVASPALGRCLPKVSSRTSSIADSHDVTGGVYKARARIHRAMADTRLLATPPSRGRVAAPDLH